MKVESRLPLSFAAIMVLLACVGCGGEMVKVDGLVTNDEYPTAQATVMFFPASGQGRPATGFTDERGRFTLTTFDQGDGIPPGEYKVTVFKDRNLTTTFQQEPARGEEPAEAIPVKPKPTNEFHLNYATVAKTPLKVKVPPGKIVLALKSDGT